MSRGRPLSFDRTAALYRAMGLFWRKGYEATGLTELLEHMGIQRQSFYNTFGSKEELLFETIGAYGEMMHRIMRDACQGALTPFKKIDRLFLLWTDMETGWFCGNCVEHCPVSGAIKMEHPLNQRVGWKRKETGEYFRIGMKNPPPPNTRPPVGLERKLK